jgi:hypothetical protein
MMNHVDNDLIFLLRKEVETQLGFSLNTPSNFDSLILRIKDTTGEYISLSTLKRLWGYVEYKQRPSLSTLSILARFAEYRDWNDFCEKKQGGQLDNSGFISKDDERMTELHPGEELGVEWHPDRYCHIRCEAPGRFVVISAYNSKLQPGDTFTASVFAVGHPLYMSNFCRDGSSMPPYVAGAKAGLTSVKLLLKVGSCISKPDEE